MKTKAFLLSALCLAAAAVQAGDIAVSTLPKIPQSLRNEADASMQRGVEFLMKKQDPANGSWMGDAALTGLAATALRQSPQYAKDDVRKAVEAARKFMLSVAQANGSFSGAKPQYVNYTTAVCLSALAIINNPEDVAVMKKARGFLIDLQLDENNKERPTSKDNPFYGGIGYGSGGPDKPDLSNTQWALEALYLTEYLDKDKSSDEKLSTGSGKSSDMAWKNAIVFLQKVQNVPESADAAWIVNANDPKADGGFIYMPGNSKASDKAKDTETLRSYGSMTYAGLKSMVYAKLKKDDVRVKAAFEWAKSHYTLDENPGMGAEGHFYYLLTFSKALGVMGEDLLKTSDGQERSWRVDLIKKLLALQKGEGQWLNENGRWMESMPELVTSYALISMEVAIGGQDLK